MDASTKTREVGRKRGKFLSQQEALALFEILEDSEVEFEDSDDDGWMPEPQVKNIFEDSDSDSSVLSCEELDLPGPSTVKHVKDSKKRHTTEKKRKTVWKKGNFKSPNTEFKPVVSDSEDLFLLTPFQYFSKYFPPAIFSELAEKTNMYSVSTEGKTVDTNEGEIRKCVALHLLMGVIPFPRQHMYWNPSTSMKLVENIGISKNRFKKLRNMIHIVDLNAEHNTNDRIWKVRPIIQSFQKRSSELVLEEDLCIDESMVPFKGQVDIKQYVKGKPNPWGIKIFMLCGKSGTIYNSVVYQGTKTPVDESLQKRFGSTAAIVLQLCNRIPDGVGHKLFFDNFFNSIPLLSYLLDKRIFAAGTIRQNRLERCPIETEKEMKKRGRGSMTTHISSDENVNVVTWYDNKVVKMASNFAAEKEQDVVRRWSKKDGKYIEINRPRVVALYNSSMGGVDNHDFLASLYRISIRCRKWTVRLMFHYFSMGIINSWMEYRNDASKLGIIPKNQLDLLNFTLKVAEALAFKDQTTNTAKRGRPSNSPIVPPKKRLKPSLRPVEDVRYDNIGHMIERSKVQQRCKFENCNFKTTSFCEKCNVYLCFHGERNCFKSFHTK